MIKNPLDPVDTFWYTILIISNPKSLDVAKHFNFLANLWDWYRLIVQTIITNHAAPTIGLLGYAGLFNQTILLNMETKFRNKGSSIYVTFMENSQHFYPPKK